jgi:hypothetical protein
MRGLENEWTSHGQGEDPGIDLSHEIADSLATTAKTAKSYEESHGIKANYSLQNTDGDTVDFQPDELDGAEPSGKPGEFWVRFKGEVGEHKVTAMLVSAAAIAACVGSVRYYNHKKK